MNVIMFNLCGLNDSMWNNRVFLCFMYSWMWKECKQLARTRTGAQYFNKILRDSQLTQDLNFRPFLVTWKLSSSRPRENSWRLGQSCAWFKLVIKHTEICLSSDQVADWNCLLHWESWQVEMWNTTKFDTKWIQKIIKIWYIHSKRNDGRPIVRLHTWYETRSQKYESKITNSFSKCPTKFTDCNFCAKNFTKCNTKCFTKWKATEILNGTAQCFYWKPHLSSINSIIRFLDAWLFFALFGL